MSSLDGPDEEYVSEAARRLAEERDVLQEDNERLLSDLSDAMDRANSLDQELELARAKLGEALAEVERLRALLPPSAHTGVRNGPGEGSWAVFAEKVVEERDEFRHKLAGEAAHIKSLEGLLVEATRERDEAVRRAERAEAMLVEERARPAVEAAAKLFDSTEQLTLRLVPSVPEPLTEEQKRDEALDLLAEARAELIRLALSVAKELCETQGSVTSSAVLKELRRQGHGPLVDSVDRRFMGVVFRSGWEQTGWAESGSHRRKQPVWRLRRA